MAVGALHPLEAYIAGRGALARPDPRRDDFQGWAVLARGERLAGAPLPYSLPAEARHTGHSSYARRPGDVSRPGDPLAWTAHGKVF